MSFLQSQETVSRSSPQPAAFIRFNRETLEKAFDDMASAYQHTRQAGVTTVQALIDKLLAEVARRPHNPSTSQVKLGLLSAQRSLMSFNQFNTRRQDMPETSSHRLRADNFYPLLAASVKKVTFQALREALTTLYGAKN